METLIHSTSRTEYAFYFRGTCGKKTGTVTIYPDGQILVCCENAAHQVWRGPGRHFIDLRKALEGYKSTEMRALIRAAATLNDTEGETPKGAESSLLKPSDPA